MRAKEQAAFFLGCYQKLLIPPKLGETRSPSASPTSSQKIHGARVYVASRRLRPREAQSE